MKKMKFAVITAFALMIFGACTPEQSQRCPDGSLAVRAYSNVCGCYTWVCPTPPPTNGCNTCGGGGNGGGNTGGGTGVVTYNFKGSVFSSGLLTSVATQSAFAFGQDGELVLENSGVPMTSPKLYTISINPWNGTDFFPAPNMGQALITNFQSSQSAGLYNRMVSELSQTNREVALQNTMDYINFGTWNANFYYVVVTLRKNDDGTPVGKTQTGTYIYYEVTDYHIVRGTNNSFF